MSRVPCLVITSLLAVTLVFVAAFAAFAAPLAAGEAPTIRGLWLTEEGDGIVRIDVCSDDATKLCGRLIWVEEPLDGQNQLDLDDENPDAQLRKRSILGLPILEGFPMESDDGVFEGGTIYDPNNGKTYSCKITPDGSDVLKIRGFLGVALLGRTTTWHRVASVDALAGHVEP